MLRVNRMFIMLVLAALFVGACLPTAPRSLAPTTSGPSLTPITATVPAPTAPPTTVPKPTPLPATVPAPTLPAGSGAAPAEKDKTTSELVDFTSQALAGNLLGDPATRKIGIVLPPGYATSSERYPVVYFLHGYTGNELSGMSDFQWSFEDAHKTGGVRDMIMVFPDASNKLGGSWYLNSPSTGNYETYIVRELVDYVDSHFRTIPRSDSRGITGCSMGAAGAIHLALKYPDVFSVTVPDSAPYDWGPVFIGEDAKLFTHPPKDMADFNSLDPALQGDISVAAAAAPNPNNPPFYLDMPFMISDGKPQAVAAVWDKIRAADPIHDAMRYAKQTQRLRAIMLYHGGSDTQVDKEVARQYDKLLTNLGIEHSYVEVADDGHCELDLRPVLKFMSDHLSHETP